MTKEFSMGDFKNKVESYAEEHRIDPVSNTLFLRMMLEEDSVVAFLKKEKINVDALRITLQEHVENLPKTGKPTYPIPTSSFYKDMQTAKSSQRNKFIGNREDASQFFATVLVTNRFHGVLPSALREEKFIDACIEHGIAAHLLTELSRAKPGQIR